MSAASLPAITILQISDLESALVFKRRIAVGELSSKKRWKEATNLLKKSLSEAKKAGKVQQIDLLVLNGDCVKGSRQEKETVVLKANKFAGFANHFVVPVGEFLGKHFGTQHVVIVPGNHDVLRKNGDSTASIEKVNDRLTGFFEMVEKVAVRLHGKLTVSTAPKSAVKKVVSFRIGGGAFEVFPLNSALLSGASIEMIASALSGRGEKPLELKEYKRIIVASKSIEDSVEKAAEIVEKGLKDKLSSDAALVPQQHLDQLALPPRTRAKGPPAPCRIAIVHHNSVPYPHETSGRVKSYGFCNSGAFHEKLLDGGFRFVLHGHQHEARIFELADLSHSPADEATHPRRCLFIGARSFGSDETPQSLMGFNLIQLSRPVPDACSAKITHVDFTATKNDGVDAAKKVERQITHVSTVPPVGNGKHRIAEALLQSCLQASHHERFEHFLHQEDSTAELFYGDLRQTRDVFQTIYAIYSVSVFEPKLWGESRYAEFFLPEARHNLAKAAAIAKSLEAEIAAARSDPADNAGAAIGVQFQGFIHGAKPGLHFHFSKPVFSGVQRANRNAEKLAVASKFAGQDGNLDEKSVRILLERRPVNVRNREFSFFARTLKSPRHAASQQPINKHDSLSIWDNAALLSGLVLDNPDVPNIPANTRDATTAKLLSRPFYEGIALSLSPIDGFVPSKPESGQYENEYKQLREFPRIVLWTMEQFQQPQALECIEFHEYCGFPLFWLNPERLKGPRQKLRKRFGHFSILGQTADAPVDHRARPNDEHGRTLEIADMVEGGEQLAGVTEAIWGKSNVPTPPLLADSDHIREFVYLVQRPDLMFAADAWAISRIGDEAWREMDQFLTRQLADVNSNQSK